MIERFSFQDRTKLSFSAAGLIAKDLYGMATIGSESHYLSALGYDEKVDSWQNIAYCIDNDSAVGVGTIYQSKDNDRMFNLNNIVVAKAHRGKKIARIIINELEHIALSQHNSGQVSLELVSSDVALDMYLHLDYEPIEQITSVMLRKTVSVNNEIMSPA